MGGIEYFDIYDSENKSLNIVKPRRNVHLDGDWHRTSQVWVLNRRNELLCNLRSKEKDVFANYWDLSIGGHVTAGDTYESTAIRELGEELGIEVTLNELKILGDEKVDGSDEEKNLIDREHARLFLYFTAREIDQFKIQEEEIECIKFIEIDELIEVVKNNNEEFKLIPIKKHFLRILEKLKDRNF